MVATFRRITAGEYDQSRLGLAIETSAFWSGRSRFAIATFGDRLVAAFSDEVLSNPNNLTLGKPNQLSDVCVGASSVGMRHVGKKKDSGPPLFRGGDRLLSQQGFEFHSLLRCQFNL